MFIAKCITRASSESHSSSIERQVCARLLHLCCEMNDRKIRISALSSLQYEWALTSIRKMRQGFRHKHFSQEASPGNTPEVWGAKQRSEGSPKSALSRNSPFENAVFHWQAARQELQRFSCQRAETGVSAPQLPIHRWL